MYVRMKTGCKYMGDATRLGVQMLLTKDFLSVPDPITTRLRNISLSYCRNQMLFEHNMHFLELLCIL